MAGSLVASYGTLATMAGKMLYPSAPSPRSWVFVADVAGVRVGDSWEFRTPIGAKVVIARQGEAGEVSDFAAFSSVCPHLGCQVHWEGPNERFFCPCHNGTFDRRGVATGGPPFAANQHLPQYPLRIENGMLFVEVPVESVVQARTVAMHDRVQAANQLAAQEPPPRRDGAVS